MAKDINQAVMTGRLGKDVEIRYAKSGDAIGNFSLAVGDRTKKNGEWEDETDWWDVVVFGKTAENCEKFSGKGLRVVVTGKFKNNNWTDNDGNKRYGTQFKASDVQFVDFADEKGKEGGGDKPKQQEIGGNVGKIPCEHCGGKGCKECDVPF